MKLRPRTPEEHRLQLLPTRTCRLARRGVRECLYIEVGPEYRVSLRTLGAWALEDSEEIEELMQEMPRHDR